MIDTTIEIRSTDRDWLIKSLRYLANELEGQTFDKNRGVDSAHNYDLFYNIEKVKEIA
jgi:hypothetical protein